MLIKLTNGRHVRVGEKNKHFLRQPVISKEFVFETKLVFSIEWKYLLVIRSVFVDIEHFTLHGKQAVPQTICFCQFGDFKIAILDCLQLVTLQIKCLQFSKTSTILSNHKHVTLNIFFFYDFHEPKKRNLNMGNSNQSVKWL